MLATVEINQSSATFLPKKKTGNLYLPWSYLCQGSIRVFRASVFSPDNGPCSFLLIFKTIYLPNSSYTVNKKLYIIWIKSVCRWITVEGKQLLSYP